MTSSPRARASPGAAVRCARASDEAQVSRELTAGFETGALITDA